MKCTRRICYGGPVTVYACLSFWIPTSFSYDTSSSHVFAHSKARLIVGRSRDVLPLWKLRLHIGERRADSGGQSCVCKTILFICQHLCPSNSLTVWTAKQFCFRLPLTRVQSLACPWETHKLLCLGFSHYHTRVDIFVLFFMEWLEAADLWRDLKAEITLRGVVMGLWWDLLWESLAGGDGRMLAYLHFLLHGGLSGWVLLLSCDKRVPFRENLCLGSHATKLFS